MLLDGQKKTDNLILRDLVRVIFTKRGVYLPSEPRLTVRVIGRTITSKHYISWRRFVHTRNLEQEDISLEKNQHHLPRKVLAQSKLSVFWQAASVLSL